MSSALLGELQQLVSAHGYWVVALTISGLEDDSGTLTFSDQVGHAVVVTIVNGQAVDSQGHPISTVNLSSLSDGTNPNAPLVERAGMVVRANGKSDRCVEYVRRTFGGLARIGLDDPKVTEPWEGVNSHATC